MKKIYVCPKCSSLIDLYSYEECKLKIKNKNGIYDFILDKNYKTTFDEIGYHYYQNDNPLIQEEIAKSISELVTSGNVLDLGCGEGSLAIPLLKNDFNNLICIDSSFVMLEKFLKNLENINYNKDRLTLIRADALNIPLINESTDLVIANNLFHLVDDPIKVLEEIYRVLSTIGMLIQISSGNDDTYEEYGENIEKYYEIKNLYNQMYWNKMKDNNYFPKKNKSSFNIHLEAKKLFKDSWTLITNPIEYSGVKLVNDYILKEYSKSDYSKMDIPTALHLKVHEEVVLYLMDKYKEDYLNITINYNGRSSSIIDVYKK